MSDIPADFADNWHKMTIKEMAQHYRMCRRTVARICKLLNLERDGVKIHMKLRPMPDGFAINAHLAESTLRTRYSCGVAAIRRWRKELGFDATAKRIADYAPVTQVPAVRNPRVPLAAKYLQKDRPVYRCDPNGKFGGTTHWRVGRQVMTDSALLEKAVAMGWDGDEWRRVGPIAHLNTIAQGGV